MRWRPGPSSRTRPPHCCRNPASGHNPAHIMRSQAASVLLWKPLPQRPEDEETDKDASEIAQMPPRTGICRSSGVSCASSESEARSHRQAQADSHKQDEGVTRFLLHAAASLQRWIRLSEKRSARLRYGERAFSPYTGSVYLSVASDASAAGQWRRAIGPSMNIGFQHPSQEAIRKAEPPGGSSALFRTISAWAISRGVPRRRGRS